MASIQSQAEAHQKAGLAKSRITPIMEICAKSPLPAF